MAASTLEVEVDLPWPEVPLEEVEEYTAGEFEEEVVAQEVAEEAPELGVITEEHSGGLVVLRW